MMNWLAQWLVSWYPRAWRDRYEDEFRAMLEQYPVSLLDVCDIIINALAVRSQVIPRPVRMTVNRMRLGTAALAFLFAVLMGLLSLMIVPPAVEANEINGRFAGFNESCCGDISFFVRTPDGENHWFYINSDLVPHFDRDAFRDTVARDDEVYVAVFEDAVIGLPGSHDIRPLAGIRTSDTAYLPTQTVLDIRQDGAGLIYRSNLIALLVFGLLLLPELYRMVRRPLRLIRA